MRRVPGIIDVLLERGERATNNAAPDLIIEVPHGATQTEDFTSLEQLLTSPLPPSLIDFFYVNTDAGAFELAEAVARLFVSATPERTVEILRCRIPRTFIDCNRRIDASPSEFREGKVTPGLMPWITSPEDRALLRGRYDRYVAAVKDAANRLSPNGAMLLLHSYAPRTVDVEVDNNIVDNLHRAYAPDKEATWPLRPEVDIIGRAIDGTSYAPQLIVTALKEGLARVGVTLAEGVTYPLHPSTLAFDHVMSHPGRALCLEVRRDLLADPFDPFKEMRIGRDKVDRLASPLAEALQRWW